MLAKQQRKANEAAQDRMYAAHFPKKLLRTELLLWRWSYALAWILS